MSRKLFIVESPSKAKTIRGYLGNEYILMASFGHIFDLPKRTYGIDFENKFEPEFVASPKGKKILKEMIQNAKTVDEIYLASDPDREGEAIAYHLKTILKKYCKKIYRVKLKEITQKEVLKALEFKTDVDDKLVESQFARRILDRIFGFELSPVLWRKLFNNHLSAGRVQSVALKWIVELEEKINQFVSEDYFSFHLEVESKTKEKFIFSLDKTLKIPDEKTLMDFILNIFGKPINLVFKEDTLSIDVDPFKKDLVVVEVQEKKIVHLPPQPFITSSLQKEASNFLHWSPEKTMKVAQKLYEGVNTGSGRKGIITYMRTDSYRVSEDFADSAKKYIEKKFGKEFLGYKKNFKEKKNSQDAHESIRPTDLQLDPETVKKFLSPDEFNLYKLIFKKFLQSQMSEAEYLKQDIIGLNQFKFFYSAKKLIKPGYKILEEKKVEETIFYDFKIGEKLKIKKLLSEKKKTLPPSRFTEASLVDELEKTGIGRPSTYANVLKTLYLRNYAKLEKKFLVPEKISASVIAVLKERFQDLIENEFTKDMETRLDQIAVGKETRYDFISEFYKKLTENKSKPSKSIPKVNLSVKEKQPCPKCDSYLELKKSKKGKSYFLCRKFPICDYMKYED